MIAHHARSADFSRRSVTGENKWEDPEDELILIHRPRARAGTDVKEGGPPLRAT